MPGLSCTLLIRSDLNCLFVCLFVCLFTCSVESLSHFCLFSHFYLTHAHSFSLKQFFLFPYLSPPLFPLSLSIPSFTHSHTLSLSLSHTLSLSLSHTSSTASEIGTLFLVRRRLQEMYDEEENQRRLRNSVDRSQSVDTLKEVRVRK